MFSNTALRILRRILGGTSRDQGAYAGAATALDGSTAVALTEAAISEAAALGASFPADLADLAWRGEQGRMGTNLAGLPLCGLTAGGPRGILSAAAGLAMTGTRATAFLSATDLAAGRDLLSAAAGRRAPLVLHLVNRAIGGQAATPGSGHEALHLVADSGCFVLTATNVQEAVDYTLIARQVAEQALAAGVVAMDGDSTALAMQDVRLLPSALAEEFLGRPGDLVPTPNAAQQLLFGDTRRRVPRWHNPDRPVLLGGPQATRTWGLGRSAGRAFLDAYLPEALDHAFTQFAELTGRRHQRLSTHGLQDARLILVAQGAAVEAAEAVADHLRGQHRVRVGVIGVRCLSPFPGGEISHLLGSAERVCVLERTDTPLADDPPLLRELRAALNRAAENARCGAQIHPGYQALPEKHRPRLLSVIFGLGGQPLWGRDLIALCRDIEALARSRVYLGVNFSPPASAYPKRQVLLDRLRRSYPDIADLGIMATDPAVELRPDGAVSLAIHRLSGQAGGGLAASLAVVLQRILGGGLRCRPALPGDPWGAQCVDRVTAAPSGLRDHGDQGLEDLVLVTDDSVLSLLGPTFGLGPDSRLLVQSALPDEVLWLRLPLAAQGALKKGAAQLHRLAPPGDGVACGTEYLVGATCSLLLQTGHLEITRRRLIADRSAALQQELADVAPQLAAFEAGLDAPRRIDVTALVVRPSPVAPGDDEAPALVRNVGSRDAGYDSLPRFWDQVGVLYRHAESAELAPDPYLAVAAMPARSAGLRDLSPLRQGLPVLDPALCTGCGDCWTACPDSALNAVALNPAQLIDAGIRRSGLDELRPLAGRLAGAVTQLCGAAAGEQPTVGGLLAEAYAGIKGKLPFPEQRKLTMQAALDRLIADLGCLPATVAGPFFDTPEATHKGSGELLFISVDPMACKSCGLCIRACAPGALQLAHQSSRLLGEVRRIREAWDGLPDTGPASIERLEQHPDLGVSAALQLNRDAALAVAGGDGSEPGSGAKLALRMVLTTFEARQAPRFRRFTKQVEETRDRISGLIREILAGALPAEDLDALARGLAGVDSRQADLSVFLGEAEQAIDNALDAARLGRLVTLARALTDLAWRLAQGRQGLGRARTGLVLSATSPAGWAVTFPHNPFSGPVVWDGSGDGAELAAGLLEGQLRQATEGFVLMRKARLELDRPEDASRLWSDLERLSWRELDDEERSLCPALLLAGDSGLLGGRGLGQLVHLLASDLPVRILLLADLDLGLADRVGLDTARATSDDPGIDLGLLSLARRDACIAQTSLGATRHLGESLDMALGARGPALLHMHAPSPARHGFDANLTLERARAAVDTRVFPLFRYDPEGAGVFGLKLALEDNPAAREPWSEVPDAGILTPAHWALGERRFAYLFEPLGEAAPDPLPLADYLGLPGKDRRGRTPYVEQATNGAQARRLRVDERLVRVCAQRQQAWQMLQELAGLVTPFTERVRNEAEQQVAAQHAAQLAQQAQAYEQRIEGLHAQMQAQNRQALRERLMHLAGYRRPDNPQPEPDR